MTKDPVTGLEVRPTDNGLHHDDFYPEYQEAEMLYLDPAGEPYMLVDEFPNPPVGDGDICKEVSDDDR